MAKTIEALVTPDLLVWARETSGLPLESAAQFLKVEPKALEAWEKGTVRPSLGKVEQLAKLYKRPVSLFYLAAPPQEKAFPQDFRTGPGAPLSKTPQLRYWLHRASELRLTAVEISRALGLDTDTRLPRITLKQDPELAGAHLRAALMPGPLTVTSASDYYKAWKEAAEAAGVLVFQIPPTAQLDGQALSGFSIGEFPLPAAVVNRGVKYSSRRLFTLVHELAHLALRSAGVCDLEDPESLPPEKRRVEVFCNAVVAAALVPLDELKSHPLVRNARPMAEWPQADISELARDFGVSLEVVVRRLLTMELVSREFYQQWRRASAPPPEAAEETVSGEAQIPGHIQTLTWMGKRFVRLVLLGQQHDVLTLADACNYLGAKVHQLDKLAHAVL